jgi:predicted helicase
MGARPLSLPLLPTEGLRDCQVEAITNLEQSFATIRPRVLIQMANGSGKTYTAVSAVYRLLKYGNARRIQHELRRLRSCQLSLDTAGPSPVLTLTV